MVVPSKVPAHSDSVVDAERLFVRARVGRSEVHIEWWKRSDAVIREAQLEVFWERNGEAQGFLVSERRHGPGVFDLRDVVAEEESRLVEEIGVAKKRARERLKFQIAADDVARERGACWLGLIAPTKIGLVMGRGNFEISIAAKKALAEKQRPWVAVLRWGERLLQRDLACLSRRLQL